MLRESRFSSALVSDAADTVHLLPLDVHIFWPVGTAPLTTATSCPPHRRTLVTLSGLGMDFYTEIAKLRAARRLWATLVKEKFQVGVLGDIGMTSVSR